MCDHKRSTSKPGRMDGHILRIFSKGNNSVLPWSGNNQLQLQQTSTLASSTIAVHITLIPNQTTQDQDSTCTHNVFVLAWKKGF